MKKKDKKELLYFSSLLAGGGLIAKALAIPHSIILAKFLSPGGFGILQIINIIMKYFGYAQLGILQGMNRNVPRAYANKEFKKAKQIKNLAFSWLSIVLLCLIITLWSLFLLTDIFPDMINKLVMIILTCIIVISRLNAYLKPFLKSEGEFIIIGKTAAINSFISPIAGIILVIYFNLLGAISAILVSQIITAFSYLYYYKNIKLKFYFNFILFKEQISSGFLIFIGRFSENLIVSLSILLIGYYYNSYEVGVYSFGFLNLLNVKRLSSSINIYFYRDVMLSKGSDDKKNNYHKKMLKLPYVFNQYINTMLLSIFSVTYILLILIYLPKYNNSIPIFYITTFGLIFYNSRIFQSQFFDATNQLKLRLVIIVLSGLISTFFSYMLLEYNYPIYFIAISCAMVFIIISTLFILIAIKQMYGNSSLGLLLLFKTFLIASTNSIIIYLFSLFNFISVDYGVIVFLLFNLLMKFIVVSIINYLMFSILYSNHSFNNELNRMLHLIFDIIIRKIKPQSSKIN